MLPGVADAAEGLWMQSLAASTAASNATTATTARRPRVRAGGKGARRSDCGRGLFRRRSDPGARRLTAWGTGRSDGLTDAYSGVFRRGVDGPSSPTHLAYGATRNRGRLVTAPPVQPR